MEEKCIEQLEQTGNYKIIRRYVRPDFYNESGGQEILKGIFLDSETTGLNAQKDKVIEIAIVPFEFDRNGNIYRILPEYDALNDPGIPIPDDITRLTGITDKMVAGQSIDLNRVAEILKDTRLVIAHNAGFDRPFMENLFDGFKNISWACSIRDVDWKEEGFESNKLEYLAYKFGFFYEGHRATIDCLAGIHLLSQTLPVSGISAMEKLLQSARTPTYRLLASNAPFSKKDDLRKRGYRWNNDQKVWYKNISAKRLDDEQGWLKQNVYGGRLPKLPKTKITAMLRYSARI